jgi:hypothetical protein
MADVILLNICLVETVFCGSCAETIQTNQIRRTIHLKPMWLYSKGLVGHFDLLKEQILWSVVISYLISNLTQKLPRFGTSSTNFHMPPLWEASFKY